MKNKKNVKLSQGDVIKVDFNPVSGHEQGNYRPAVVISNADFFELTSGLAIVMPISNSAKSFPTHIPLETVNGKVTGSILTQHVRTLDLNARDFEKTQDCLTEETLKKCKEMHNAFFE